MVLTLTEHAIQGGGQANYGVAAARIRTAPSSLQVTGARQSTGLVGSGSLATDEITESLTRTAGDLNKIAQDVQRNLSFSVDEPSGRTVIRVVDGTTGETIRQIPTEEALALVAHLKSLLDTDTRGLLIASQA